MIDGALKFLQDQANPHLRNVLDSGTEEPLSISPIVTPNGDNAIKSRLGMALVKMDEERVQKSQTRHKLVDGKIVYYSEPDIKLNLYVLIAASPEGGGAKESLKAISAVVSFFQARSSFDKQTYPSLDPIEKLVVNMETLDFETQNHIWGALGAKYLPSVVYKVGVLTIQRGLVEMTTEPILSREVNSAS